MEQATKIVRILEHRGRGDIARLLKKSTYQIDERTTYGSYLFSVLSSVELFSPLHLNEKLVVLPEEDKKLIFDAFLTLYPPQAHSPEIVNVEFFIDPEAELIPETSYELRIKDIDFEYIQDQLDKCDEKLGDGDYDGAITNARTLIENICLYILDTTKTDYVHKGDLPRLYKQTAKILNMVSSQHTELMFKQILSGFVSIINGLAAIRNIHSDAHGKSSKSYYKPAKRHATFIVNSSKAVAEFLYSSYEDNANIT